MAVAAANPVHPNLRRNPVKACFTPPLRLIEVATAE
jgi:hypothetical protein